MKRVMRRLLEGQVRGRRGDDVGTIAEICEIALDNGEYKIAKEQAIQAIKLLSPYHAESVKFHCILLRAFYGMDFTAEAAQYFSKALATLDHHWGPFHPLNSIIYGIMAHLLIQQGKMEEAKDLY
jgi:tetratricopeptide (TPR) repeat protein